MDFSTLFRVFPGEQGFYMIPILLAFFWIRFHLTKLRTNDIRTAKANIFYVIYLLWGIVYSILILQNWIHDRHKLNAYEHYTILVIIILLFSGIFVLALIFCYFSNPESIIVRDDIKEHLTKHKKLAADNQLAESQLRVDALKEIARAFASATEMRFLGRLPHDAKRLGQYKKFFSDAIAMFFARTNKIYQVYEISPNNALVFGIHKSDGSLERQLYYVSDGRKIKLFDSEELPVYGNSEPFLDDISATKTSQFITELITFEEGLRKDFRVPRYTVSAGYMWYYVMLVILGNDNEHIIPSGFVTKGLFLFLLLFRFLVITCFLTITIDAFVK